MMRRPLRPPRQPNASTTAAATRPPASAAPVSPTTPSRPPAPTSTSTAASEAPLVTPTMSGLASGLRVIDCVIAPAAPRANPKQRSEEHTSELQSREKLVCRLLLEKEKHADCRRQRVTVAEG